MSSSVFQFVNVSLFLHCWKLKPYESPCSWKFWPIVHCVTYSVIPAQHRVLWVNSVDLVWNAILSSAAQKDETESVESESMIGVENEAIGPTKSGTDVVPANQMLLETVADASGGGHTNTTNCTAAFVGI